MVHSINYIKSNLSKIFKNHIPPVLYGGSVDSSSIYLFKNLRVIDGFLIGGASKSPKNFIDIIKISINNVYETILIVANIVLAIVLIIIVLIQRSEGGALGLGLSQDNFASTRSVGNFLTKTTAVIATLFIISSISLVVLSRGDLEGNTISFEN